MNGCVFYFPLSPFWLSLVGNAFCPTTLASRLDFINFNVWILECDQQGIKETDEEKTSRVLVEGERKMGR